MMEWEWTCLPGRRAGVQGEAPEVMSFEEGEDKGGNSLWRWMEAWTEKGDSSQDNMPYCTCSGHSN